MANKWRGEVAFPALGANVFISFPLGDMAELESIYGDDFFGVVEKKLQANVTTDYRNILAIGLKSRDEKGEESKIWESVGVPAFYDNKFIFADFFMPIMDSICLSWLGRDYTTILNEAMEEAKKADAAKLQRAKEAADKAGVPFSEALSEGLYKLLTDLASTPSKSGG